MVLRVRRMGHVSDTSGYPLRRAAYRFFVEYKMRLAPGFVLLCSSLSRMAALDCVGKVDFLRENSAARGQPTPLRLAPGRAA